MLPDSDEGASKSKSQKGRLRYGARSGVLASVTSFKQSHEAPCMQSALSAKTDGLMLANGLACT